MLGKTGKCRKETFNLHCEDLSSIYSSATWRYYSPSFYSRSSVSGSSPMGCEDWIQPSLTLRGLQQANSPLGSQDFNCKAFSCSGQQPPLLSHLKLCSREVELEGSRCSQCLHPTVPGDHLAGMQCGFLPLFPLFLPQFVVKVFAS